MKNLLTSSLRAATLTLALVLASATAARAADQAARQLAATGTVVVESAGPYVGIGTYLIQVSAKLGQPSAKLTDGTWLYEGFTAGESATGTLVVRFNDGRVSSLSLATPAAVTALRTKPVKFENKALAAAWNQR